MVYIRKWICFPLFFHVFVRQTYRNAVDYYSSVIENYSSSCIWKRKVLRREILSLGVEHRRRSFSNLYTTALTKIFQNYRKKLLLKIAGGKREQLFYPCSTAHGSKIIRAFAIILGKFLWFDWHFYHVFINSIMH